MFTLIFGESFFMQGCGGEQPSMQAAREIAWEAGL